MKSADSAPSYASRFVAIEGTDGAGKATNTEALARHINDNYSDQGLSAEIISFPRYHTPPGRVIRHYLSNGFGPAAEINPELSAYLFTVDRHHAADDIRRALSLGRFVVADRFTGSNLAHQGAKLPDRNERRSFYEHTMRREYHEWQIPRPEFNFVLFVSQAVAKVRREQRLNAGQQLDGHEMDESYQLRTADAYAELCELYPNEFIPIDCMDGERQLPPERVSQKLIQAVEETL